MRRLFPISARVSDVRAMGGAILLYLAISVVSGVVLGMLTAIPLLGPLMALASQMLNLYCLGGIVTAVLFWRNMIG